MSENWRLTGSEKDGATITSDWQLIQPRLIEGVNLREVKPVPAGYGYLTEVFRTEWNLDELPVDQVFQSTLIPGAVSAWHAHEFTTDRLFANLGMVRIVLYDARPESPSYGTINEFRLGSVRPGLVIIPPKVWHGVQNYHHQPSSVLNLVDRAYRYEDPDHWRLPADSPQIPYRFPQIRAGSAR